MRILSLIVFIIGLFLAPAVGAQATQPTQDAAPLYLQAMKLVVANYDRNIMSPAASNTSYPPYPPFSAEWQNMEKTCFETNAQARALAHDARSIEHANWPPEKAKNPVLYLNNCRALGNDLADAALYQHLHGNDAAAVESIRDLLHLADLLENQSNKTFIRLLVSLGIRALAMDRLNVISSNVALSKDSRDANAVQVGVARELIDQVLKEQAQVEMNNVGRAEQAVDKATIKMSTVTDLIETANRVDTECEMTAMSLACHLYRVDTGGWPKSLTDLHGYLATVPIDPFGDGKQTLGYVLIKGGLPDGTDRPLVYSRLRSKDGLFILNDQPRYSFYNGDGSNLPEKAQKQGGQFRDVASWAPTPGRALAATTQPPN
jgi:hypothetical protein